MVVGDTSSSKSLLISQAWYHWLLRLAAMSVGVRHIFTTSANCGVTIWGVSWVKSENPYFFIIISDFTTLEYRYAMWRYDEPKPEQVNRNTQTSPGLSSRWGQIATGSFPPPWPIWDLLNSLACIDNKDMHDEIERLQRVCGERPLYTSFI